jgi:acetyltransferase
MVTIKQIRMPAATSHLDDLVTMLVDIVQGGASVGFLADITPEEAQAFWQTVLEATWQDSRVLLIAEDDDGRTVGTAQLDISTRPNGRHRAEVQKVLVHPQAQGQGVGRQLMEQLERLARERQLKLLVLDTTLGSAGERLYSRLGYVRLGEIPDFAVYPDGQLHPTVVFYKQL